MISIFLSKIKIAISNKEWYNYGCKKDCERSNIKVNISSVTLHTESFRIQVNQVVNVNKLKALTQTDSIKRNICIGQYSLRIYSSHYLLTYVLACL